MSRDPPLVRGGPLFTSHDAVETAIVDRLASANQKVAPDAWLRVRQRVRELALAGTDDIWIVMSATGYSHAAVDGAAAAAEVAAGKTEAFYVISVRECIATARSQFDAELRKFRARQEGARQRQVRA